ncbi:hypothetical protein HanPI659440_Chr03g0105071 [Helianthus annuus]|nr:hypothetical protein HanPI659440_Chr03g0105071 [Helianthus annuus]
MIFYFMLWIGFSSDICKSDTSALVGLGCYMNIHPAFDNLFSASLYPLFRS